MNSGLHFLQSLR